VAVENKEKTKIIRTIPAKKQITIQDLLRHTSGLTYGGFGRTTAVRLAYKNANLSPIQNTSQQFIKTISKLPLMAHPGERWEYSYATDVLGCLVEVVSGMTLDAFFKKYIFEPLKMKDTGFHVPEDQLFRAAQGYDYKTKTYPLHLRDVSKSPRMYSGGGGLVSTIRDYARFAQMMLNGGQLDGARLLSPKTVDLMTANHIGASVSKGDHYIPGSGHGFGLGYAVRLETGIAAVPGSKGEYRWGGWAGTGFWIDPEEQLISIYMMQDVGSSVYLRDRFKALVYQAIIE
jgi:CubicO group peptidase (beta-lactamase class C family)